MAMRKFDWDYETLRAMYASGMSTIAIGATLKRDWRLVRYHLQRAGVTIRTTGDSRISTSDAMFTKVRETIITEHQAGATVKYLQHKYSGAGKDRIANLCASLPARKIPTKPRPEITPELRAKMSAIGKIRWKQMSQDQRNYLRQASIEAKTGERNHNYGRVWSTQGRGKRTLGIGCHGQPITFRSSWEKKFADYLNGKGLIWQYEPEAIRCGELGTYTPDFYVELWGCFIEVKGWMTPKSLEKINWVRHNDIRPLILATKTVLRKQYGVEVN